MERQELELAIVEWANKYSARLDHDLINNWPGLELQLRDLVDSMTLKELTLGPRSDFHLSRLTPMIETWTDRHVVPILEDAEKGLRELYASIKELHKNMPPIPTEWNGTLHLGDLGGPGAVVAGAGVGAVAVAAGISTATSWIIFTTIVVNWYLVIAGVVVGVILIAVGFHGMAGLKAKLQNRFRKILIPKIREAVLGEGFKHDGKQVPSVMQEMKKIIGRGQAEALKDLEAGSVR